MPFFWRFSPYFKRRFPGSRRYWEERYATGGHSGSGSYGKLAAFKAEVLNDFVERHQISSVIEFGCGDGNQLSLSRYPAYVGLDVSRLAIIRNIERNRSDPTKSFFLYDPDCWSDRTRRVTADLALSLDVLYHLIEDQVFEKHLEHLFDAAGHYVIVYSSDCDKVIPNSHERHRNFTSYVDRNMPDWRLVEKIDNRYPLSTDVEGSPSDFYIFEKRAR